MDVEQSFLKMFPLRCVDCRMHKEHCICEQITTFDLPTRLVLVMHYRELKKSTASAPLALKSLKNSELRVHGLKNQVLDFHDLDRKDRRTVLLYPADDAVVLDQAFIDSDPRPINLVVPDGNWRQAKRMGRRLPGMEHATVAVLPEGPKTEWGLRREPKENGLATYEAIARAIGIIEGKEIQHNMEELFRVMVHTTMKIQGSFVNRSGLS